jgi:transposase
LIYRWKKEFSKYDSNSFPGRGVAKMTDEQREIARLKAALKDAELERDILKKAVSIFSKSDKKGFGL